MHCIWLLLFSCGCMLQLMPIVVQCNKLIIIYSCYIFPMLILTLHSYVSHFKQLHIIMQLQLLCMYAIVCIYIYSRCVYISIYIDLYRSIQYNYLSIYTHTLTLVLEYFYQHDCPCPKNHPVLQVFIYQHHGARKTFRLGP